MQRYTICCGVSTPATICRVIILRISDLKLMDHFYLMLTSVNSFRTTEMHFEAAASLTDFLNQVVLLTITAYMKISNGSGRQSFSTTRVSPCVLFPHLHSPPV